MLYQQAQQGECGFFVFAVHASCQRGARRFSTDPRILCQQKSFALCAALGLNEWQAPTGPAAKMGAPHPSFTLTTVLTPGT